MEKGAIRRIRKTMQNEKVYLRFWGMVELRGLHFYTEREREEHHISKCPGNGKCYHAREEGYHYTYGKPMELDIETVVKQSPDDFAEILGVIS